jgi:hypothetical protein
MVLTLYMTVELGVYIDVSKRSTVSIFLWHADVYLQSNTVSKLKTSFDQHLS